MPELEVDFVKETINANNILPKRAIIDNAEEKNKLAEAVKATAECRNKESQIRIISDKW